MSTILLSKRAIDNLKYTNKEEVLWDSEVKGFGVRIQKNKKIERKYLWNLKN